MARRATVGNTSSSNRLKYNGKEALAEIGPNLLDYGARLYDATIGRMKNPDALAEAFAEVSPYSYGLNNPVFYVDPTGDSTVPANALNMKTFDTQRDEVLLDAVTVKAQSSNNQSRYFALEDESGNRFNRDGSHYVSTNPNDIMMGPIVMGGSSEDDDTIDNLFAFFSPAKYLQGLALFSKINLLTKTSALAKLIGPGGDASAQITRQIPKSWQKSTVKKGNGTVFKDPTNGCNSNCRFQISVE